MFFTVRTRDVKMIYALIFQHLCHTHKVWQEKKGGWLFFFVFFLISENRFIPGHCVKIHTNTNFHPYTCPRDTLKDYSVYTHISTQME